MSKKSTSTAKDSYKEVNVKTCYNDSHMTYAQNKMRAAKPAEWFSMGGDNGKTSLQSTQKDSFAVQNHYEPPVKKIEPVRRDYNIVTGEEIIRGK